MSKHKTLSDAKSAKNDEFYTQYANIQKKINAYLAPLYVYAIMEGTR